MLLPWLWPGHFAVITAHRFVTGLRGIFSKLDFQFRDMKSILTPILLLISFGTFAQESNIFMVNTMKDDVSEFTRKLYKYKDFKDGYVIFKDSAVGGGRLNYHRLFDQVHFITGNGDTLTLKDPASIRVISIGRDSFYYFNKGFLQKLSFNEKINLAMKPAVRYIGKEKKALYGSYTEIGSVDELTTFSPDEFRTFYLGQDANLKFRYVNTFYFADRFNNFFPATRATLSDMFPDKEQEIKKFVSENKIDFDKEDHLLQLLGFLQTLIP